MNLTDEEFREQYKPVHIPAGFDEANSLQDKVLFALADLGEADAAQIVQKLEALDPAVPDKLVIANVHRVLAELHGKGLIAANENNGDLYYNLHKITQANRGEVNPDLLAPGLD
jgi:hypothetical protein